MRPRRPAARSPASTSPSTAPATTSRRATTCTDPTCDGVRTQGTGVTGKYNNYTMEVVQQIGSDSFDPGHGVLISKTKNTVVLLRLLQLLRVGHRLAPGGHQPGRLRRRRRHAEARRRIGDERQKNDASFNAGLDSGSSYEYEDTANRLHFYILDKRTDAQGILHYTVGVRSLDGAGPQTRGVGARLAAARQRRGLHDLHVQPQEHGRRGGRSRPHAPAGRLGVPRQRRLPPLGVGHRHRLGGVPQERVRHRRSSASRSRSRSTSRRAPAPARSRSTRSPRAIRPRPPSAVCTLADGDGRRLRPGHAGADDGHAGLASARSRRAWARTTSPPRRRTSSPPPVTRP